MFMRTTTYTYNPAQEGALLHLNDQHLIPLLHQLPGFVSYTYGLDAAHLPRASLSPSGRAGKPPKVSAPLWAAWCKSFRRSG